MAQIKGGLFSKGGSGSGVGFPVIEITLAQIDDNNINFTEDQFNQIMACGNFTLKLPDGTFYNFVGSNNSQQASVFFYAIKDNQTTTPTELAITQLSIVKSTYVGTISPNVYTNGGGGSQLYQHNIDIKDTSNYHFHLIIQNDNNAQFDSTSLKAYFVDNDFTNSTSKLYTLGVCKTGTTNNVGGIFYNTSAELFRAYGQNEESIVISTISDKVKEL